METTNLEPETNTGTPAQEPAHTPAPLPEKKQSHRATALAHGLERLGLGFFAPFVRLLSGDEPQKQVREILISIILPAMAIGCFVALWTTASVNVKTDSMKIPSPSETWTAWKGIQEFAERESEKAEEYETRKTERLTGWTNQLKSAEAELVSLKQSGDSAGATELEKSIASLRERITAQAERRYVGPPTFYTQIKTSLVTIAIGFVVATAIAVPLGIFCGLSKTFNTAVNPLIQIFKPVSPLAWLPIVFVFVTALYHPGDDTSVTRAMVISALTVTLCSLWPTLINTAVGVSSIDPDHMNVARVLRLNWFQRLTKIVLPSTLPLMFTGMRLSLGVGWMVLVAADMLAQNPGLGKFVWDTFQNGSITSMAEIVCAVFVIGIIGFILDRIMFFLQRLVSFEDKAI